MKRVGVIGNLGAWSSELLLNTLEERLGWSALVSADDLSVELESNRVFAGGYTLNDFDALIVKKIGDGYSPNHLDRLELLRLLEASGVRLFSSPEKIIRVLDRLSCTVTLRAHQIPMPRTVVTESIEIAARAVDSFGRSILKPLFTSRGRGMRIVKPGSGLLGELSEYRERGNDVFYVQQVVPIDGKDLGVAFLGGQYLATYVRVEEKPADGRHGAKRRYEAYEPSDGIIELAHRAQAPFGLDFTCVDIVETPDGPQVFEVSAFGGFRGLKEANGINAAERYVDYVLTKI